MKSVKIRKTFLDFFKEKSHKIIDSAPIVVKDDPTLMFINAGMNQFKDIFLGNKISDCNRVANTQKCLRVSGKHNDLDEVGVDTYHHTMFEMLGNWSFGDYFKRDAIFWAWELLVDVYGIDKNCLYVTIFKGDEKDGTTKDLEAFKFWKEKIDEDRILEFDKKDNFWEMGDAGPCGPCSEIHVDIRSQEKREKMDGSLLVNKDHPEVIELWNLVFIEYNRSSDGKLQPLPNKHVDTGMGFERLCMVLQAKSSNYDTDVFQPLICKLESLTGYKYGENKEVDIAMRVVVDHIRAIAFSISDGQLPYRDGAGYVIRRILRRGVRYGYSFLNFNSSFMNQLVPVLVEQFGNQFPEIERQKELISKVVKEEEDAFFKTLDRGITKLKGNKGDVTGKFAFELYDTYGFPIDLTMLIAKEKGQKVDFYGFKNEMGSQKKRARDAAYVKADDWIELSNGSGDEFVGYAALELQIKILRYRNVQSKNKQYYQLVFDKTPFYAESGGQVGDTGVLISNNIETLIFNTQKENNVIVHYCESIPENTSGIFIAKVDKSKRENITYNHTSTHLMHAALQNVLGNHVEQRGSLVNEKYLRFDFSHFSQLSNVEIAAVEKEVNDKISGNLPVEIKEMPLVDAKKIGAMALFGEKYGENVRVVAIGNSYSVELCGGTHVESLDNISSFKIISETSVAAGIRRIEAVTGNIAKSRIKEQKHKREKLLNDLKTAIEIVEKIGTIDDNELGYKTLQNIIIEVESCLSEIGKLQIQEQLKFKKDLFFGMVDVNAFENEINLGLRSINRLNKISDTLSKKRVVLIKEKLKSKIVVKEDCNYLFERVDIDGASQKEIAFALKREVSDLIALIGGEYNGKAILTLVISDELVERKSLNAASLLKDIAIEIKGGGGGQPFFATAGGTFIEGLPQAFDKAKEIIG